MLSVWRPKKLSRAQLEERRLQAKSWLDDSTTSSRQIAEHFGVSQSTVRSWRKRRRDHGDEALSATIASGRPPRLTSAQRAELITALRQGAKESGFDSESWTARRVTDVIERRFSIRYHPDHVRKLLHDLGWSVQQPDVRAMERDEQTVRTWVENVQPELGKKGHYRGDGRLSRRERLQRQGEPNDDLGTQG